MLAEDRVDDEVDQLVLAGNVPVERHDACAQLGRRAAHRERAAVAPAAPLAVRDGDRSLHDPFGGETGIGPGREFATLRLTGATRLQVLAVGAIEALLTTAVAAVLGAVAALITVVPFMLVRGGATEVAMPSWPFPTVVLGALAIALTATLPTAARMLRP